MWKWIFALVLLANHSLSLAVVRANRTRVKQYGLQAGTLTEFVGHIQTNSGGSTNSFDFNPTIGGLVVLPLYNGYEILPEINWVLPQQAGESRIIKNTFMFRADVGYLLTDNFRTRVGTSLMYQNIHGRGGSVNRDNGNGQSTFYYPDSNTSIMNNTFDIGVEGLWDNWAARIQVYVYSLFDSQRRQQSYILMFTHYWDNKR